MVRAVLTIDAILHALGAVIMTLALWPLFGVAAAGAAAGFWLGREWGQEEAGRGFVAGGPWNWETPHKWSEAALPGVAATMVAVLLMMWGA